MRAKGCLRYVHGFAPFHGDPEQTEEPAEAGSQGSCNAAACTFVRKTRIVNTREPAEGTGFALPPPEPAPPRGATGSTRERPGATMVKDGSGASAWN